MLFPRVCTKLSMLSTNFWDSPRTVRFLLDLVGNVEDRFSHDEAPLLSKHLSYTGKT